MVKCGLYNRRCGRDAANEQIVGYAIIIITIKDIILCFSLTNRLEEYVEEREGKIHDLQSKYVFFFVIVEGALLILWNFILENVNLRIKGTRRLILPFMFVVNVIL